MLLLSATTDKFDLVTSSTSALDVHVSYVDASGSTTSAGRQNTTITTATTTDILAAPAASTVRNARTINIRNRGAANNDVTVRLNQNATIFELHKVTVPPGATLQHSDDTGWTLVTTTTVDNILLRVLTADVTGSDVLTAQQWFPTLGAVTVAAATTYELSGQLLTTRAAGAVSHTTGLLFAGTATLTSIQYVAMVKSGDVETNAAMNATAIRVATNTTVKSASTSATETITIDIEGMVRINAGGTFIPQFIYSAAPGGAPTIKANSFLRLTRYGDNTLASLGTWT